MDQDLAPPVTLPRVERPPLSAETVFRAVMGGEDAAAEGVAAAPVPARVANFRVLSTLGEGGAGVVYCAEQDAPRRRVALKLLKRVAPQALRRFRREADALGRLQHRGIGQIYASGEATGAAGAAGPFIAMELVSGAPITTYARDHRLSVRQRLLLLLDVLDAVAYAHEQGIVHRDLKPSNILVTNAGEPKVLDFGLALDTDSGATLATEPGQVLGTLAYMSPEQARGGRLDGRTDVYALGVVAYELLTGNRPYDLPADNPAAAVRLIAEAEPPTLASVDRSLRGDLDTIVGKALEKDPARRYATVAAFAGDIRQYLSDKPIQARPPTLAYRTKKFCRRHKGLVIGAAAVGVVLVAGIVATGWQAVIARAEAARALAAEATARAEAARALNAEAVARAEAERAVKAEAVAKQRLAEALLATGHAWAAAGQLESARQAYLGAWDLFEYQGAPTLPAEFGVWDVDRKRPRPFAAWKAHADGVTAVCLSEAAATLVSAGRDRKLTVWDLKTLTARWTVDLARPAWSLRLSPDARFAAAADNANTVTLLDLAEKRVVGTWEGRETGRAVDFSGDGKYLAWSTANAVKVLAVPPVGPPVDLDRVLPASGERTTIGLIGTARGWVHVSYGGRVVEFDAAGQPLATFSGPTNGRACAVLADGKTLAVAAGSAVTLLDLSSGKVSGSIPSYAHSLAPLAGEPQRLALFKTNVVEAWASQAGTCLWSVADQAEMPNIHAASGDTVAAGNSAGDVILMRGSTEALLSRHVAHSKTPLIAVSESRDAVSFDETGSALWWDIESGTVRGRTKTSKPIVAACASTVTGAFLGDTGGQVWLWRAPDAAPKIVAELGHSIQSLALSPDGRMVLAIAEGNGGPVVVFLAAADGSGVWVPPGFGQFNGTACWESSQSAIAATAAGEVFRLNLTDRTVTGAGRLPYSPFKLAAQPNGKLFAVCQDGRVVVREHDSAKAEFLPALSDQPAGLALVDHERFLITADAVGEIFLIDLAKRQSVMSVQLDTRDMMAFAVADGGRSFAAARQSGEIIFGNLVRCAEEKRLAKTLGTPVASTRSPADSLTAWIRFHDPRVFSLPPAPRPLPPK